MWFSSKKERAPLLQHASAIVRAVLLAAASSAYRANHDFMQSNDCLGNVAAAGNRLS
jgi:hypothetical protein